MIRQLVCVLGILFGALLWANAQNGPDDKYVFIYSLIQEGDGLKQKGEGKGAVDRYTQAEKSLKDLRALYPDWNKKIVDYRLDYLADRLQELSQFAVTAPAPSVPGTIATETPNPAKLNVTLTQTPTFKEMQDNVTRLNNENDLLKAKLKEALSVQPSSTDPRELAKIEERVKALEKERDLLNASLEQEKAKLAKMVDPALLDKERELVAEIKKKMEEQATLVASLQRENAELKKQLGAGPNPEIQKQIVQQADQLAALQKENEFLKTQMTALKSASAITGKGNLIEELSIAKALVTALTETNISLRTERILLEQKVSELSKNVIPRAEAREIEQERNDLRKRLAALAKDLSRRRGPDMMPDELQRQLEVARARLEVYEASPVPYTPEEMVFFKKPDAKVSVTGTNDVRKRLTELPAGAGPLVAEAQRDIENGRFADAEKKFLQVLRQDEKNTYILCNLATVQMELNRPADAEKTVKQALAADAEDPGALYTMGILKYRQEKYDEALDALSLSAKIIPDKPMTQYFLGKAFIQKGNRAQAEKALRKAVQLRPGWGEAHFSLAMVYASQNPPFKELAQWHYQKALTGGYPRDLDFEKLVDEKKTASVP
jgi:tetratricopeptide (TPR) repeat protein